MMVRLLALGLLLLILAPSVAADEERSWNNVRLFCSFFPNACDGWREFWNPNFDWSVTDNTAPEETDPDVFPCLPGR